MKVTADKKYLKKVVDKADFALMYTFAKREAGEEKKKLKNQMFA